MRPSNFLARALQLMGAGVTYAGRTCQLRHTLASRSVISSRKLATRNQDRQRRRLPSTLFPANPAQAYRDTTSWELVHPA